MKQRAYLDTSVIGGCEDEEFAKWSVQIIEDFRQCIRIAVVSDLTRQELEDAPEDVGRVLSSLPEAGIEDVFLTPEAETLAEAYLHEKVVRPKHIADAQHIAIATVHRVDTVASWNFQHIVNLDRIRAFNSVNLRCGYPILEIRSPREIVHEETI